MGRRRFRKAALPSATSIGKKLTRPLRKGDGDGTLISIEHGIVDSLGAKSWAIKLATQAAVSVLSVDSIIMSKPAGGPKIPQQSGAWDEDD